MKLQSHTISPGATARPARAMLKALGFDDEDSAKPILGARSVPEGDPNFADASAAPARADRRPTVADGILDRLVHNARRIEMRGDRMRKTRGKVNRQRTTLLESLPSLSPGK